MQCRDFREVADSYLSDELLVETNHDVIAHLEMCADCRRELTARRELRSTLRAGFANSPELQISDQFAARFRAQLCRTALQQPTTFLTRGRAWMAIAACLLVAFGLVIGVRYRVQTPSEQRIATGSSTGEGTSTPTAKDTNLNVDVAVNEMARFAVDDHRNCAIEFRLPEAPIALEEAGRRYDRSYINLTKTVREQLAGLAGLATLVEAHSCILEGRRFAHLVLTQNAHIVSFLITDLDGREKVVGGTSAATKKDGQVISCSQVQGYQVSCFQTARHAIFVVSDLSEGDNLNLARALAPAVYQHLYRAESVA